jgi:hypothetical protein
MSLPAYGTAPIRCGKTKCQWKGYETDLTSVPHKTIKTATQSACPSCGCTSYMFMTERQIATWERSNVNQSSGAPSTAEASKASDNAASGSDA